MIRVLTYLLPGLLKLLKPELLRKAVDALLDVIERAVMDSESETDNKLVLPLCEIIRNTFNVPDND